MELELSNEEITTLREFVDFASNIAKERGVVGWKLDDVANMMGIQILAINKGGNFSVALWVEFLKITKKYLPPDYGMKYHDLSDFLNAYPNFENKSKVEKENLFNTANWMNILFEMLPAKKNKGLAMSVVPKLVEGYNAKYVTGSGQTSATSDRVFIFQEEGGVKPFARSKSSRKRKVEGEIEEEHSIKKKLSLKHKSPSDTKHEKLQSNTVFVMPSKRDIYSRDEVPLINNNNASTTSTNIDEQFQEIQLLKKYEACDELGLPLLNRQKTDLVAVEALYEELEGENRSLRNTFDENIFDSSPLLTNLSINSNINGTDRGQPQPIPFHPFTSSYHKPHLLREVSWGDIKKPNKSSETWCAFPPTHYDARQPYHLLGELAKPLEYIGVTSFPHAHFP